MNKIMDIREFRSAGYLHELNRRFLHPLGLALVAGVEGETEMLVGIIDNRDDPEGMAFETLDREKMSRIEAIVAARRPAREAALGFFIQDVDLELP